MSKVELAWLIAGLCACILLLAVIILMVQLSLQRHLRAHSRAIKNGQVQDWRNAPTRKL